MDDDGNVGIRIHASVYSTNTARYWLGAHLRFSDLSRVYSTEARYRDSNGQAAAIQGVQQFRLAGLAAAEAQVGAAGLEGFKIGAGRNFAILSGGGQPDFQVVGLGGAEADVAG